MAVYTGSVNRVTGLSGIDTESMIDKMMKAESAKYERLKKNQQTTTWKQEIFRELISKVQSFQDKWFGSNRENNLGFNAAWNNFTTEVTDLAGNKSSIVTIKGTTNSGNYNIKVNQKAETETITGFNNLNSDITSGATATEITAKINKYGDMSLKFDLDGTAQEINVTSAELAGANIEDVLNQKLTTAFGTDSVTGTQKVKVEKDVTTGKLIFSSNNANSLTISEGTSRNTGISSVQNGVLAADKTGYEITIDGFTAKVDFTGAATEDEKLKKIEEALKVAENTSGDKKDLTGYITISKEGTDGIKITNNKSGEEVSFSSTIKSTAGDTVANADLSPTGSLDIFGFSSSSNNISIGTKLTQAFGEKFKNALVGKPDGIKLNFGGKDIFLNEDDNIQSFMNKVNSSGGVVKLSFNEVTNRFKIESNKSGAAGVIDITDIDTKAFLKDFGGIDLDNKASHGALYITGQDAEFEVDGVLTTRPSNDIKMNGLQFTINGTGEVKLSATNDEDATFKKIKEFVDDYNKLTETINDKLLEKRPKSGAYQYYEPLTDEERKGMSEDEIKKWEAKAKEGLLYGDENLRKLLTDLRESIYSSIDIGGKSISLHEIGITTTNNWRDGGKLQIDEEKLKKSIRERGDEISQMFVTGGGIAEKINQNLNNAVGINGSLRKRAGIKNTSSDFSNDLSKELREISKRINQERDRLYKKEMNYFKMFSEMENAMNKQNSQMSMLSTLLSS